MKVSVVALLACVSLLPAQSTVRVVGLSVVEDGLGLGDMKSVPSWVGEGGIRVLLAVKADARLIRLERSKSSITITDGTGKDLLAPKDGKSRRFSIGPFEMNNAVSADGHTMLVGVEAPGSPSSGGPKITLKGSLTVSVASGTKKASAKVKLKPGPVPIAGVSMKIDSVGTEEDFFTEKEVMAVTISMKGAAAKDFAGLRFLDASGKPIEARRTQSMSGMGMRKATYQFKVLKLDACRIELSTWSGRKLVAIPFALTATSPL